MESIKYYGLDNVTAINCDDIRESTLEYKGFSFNRIEVEVVILCEYFYICEETGVNGTENDEKLKTLYIVAFDETEALKEARLINNNYCTVELCKM